MQFELATEIAIKPLTRTEWFEPPLSNRSNVGEQVFQEQVWYAVMRFRWGDKRYIMNTRFRIDFLTTVDLTPIWINRKLKDLFEKFQPK